MKLNSGSRGAEKDTCEIFIARAVVCSRPCRHYGLPGHNSCPASLAAERMRTLGGGSCPRGESWSCS